MMEDARGTREAFGAASEFLNPALQRGMQLSIFNFVMLRCEPDIRGNPEVAWEFSPGTSEQKLAGGCFR